MRKFLQYVPVLGVLFQSICAANPLETEAQRQLDALAIDLSQSDDLDFLRDAAREKFEFALKKFGRAVDAQVESDLDLAIDELVFSCVQKAVNGDAAYPKVYAVDGPPRENPDGLSVPGGRYSYDNPDCIYRTIPISHKYEYIIRGRRAQNSPSDFSFSLIANPNSQNTVTSLAGKDLKVDDDGSFTITISSDDADGNHLKSNLQAVQLFVRDNIGDWSSETPNELSVEVVDNKDSKPATNKTIINQAKKNLRESTFFYGFGALELKTLSQPLNKLQNPTQSQTLGTLTSQASSFGHFDLADNEALLVTVEGGKSTYWVLPVYSMGLVAHSPWKNIVSFNNKQAKPNNNGTYTFVISERDPGVYNWLNTTSRPQGTVMGRWQGLPTDTDEENGIQVQSSVVKLGDLPNLLPEETEYVDAERRQQQVQDRREGYKRIHNL